MLTPIYMHLQRAIDLGFVCSVCLSIFCEVCFYTCRAVLVPLVILHAIRDMHRG